MAKTPASLSGARFDTSARTRGVQQFRIDVIEPVEFEQLIERAKLERRR